MGNISTKLITMLVKHLLCLLGLSGFATDVSLTRNYYKQCSWLILPPHTPLHCQFISHPTHSLTAQWPEINLHLKNVI